jgi:tetratricopeptide (TPR) repeat protein/mono/diheme cytochrome c family protein/cytochrome c2
MRLRNILLLNLLFAVFGALLVAALIIQANPQWKKIQQNYFKIVAEKSADKSYEPPSPRINQIFVEDAGIVDRCTTCHLGVENPSMKDAPQPFRYHPQEILKSHSLREFGCTLCHQGEGRATNFADAVHSSPEERIAYLEKELGYRNVHSWENPMTFPPVKESPCGKCHLETRPFGKGIKGAETLHKGAELFLNRVCFRCHKIDSIGGTVGPELTGLGDKTIEEFQTTHDLSLVAKPPYNRSHITTWIYKHFKNPTSVFPERKVVLADGTESQILPTIMPNFKFPDDEANALTAFVLSLRRADLPRRYISGFEDVKGKTDDAHILFTSYCARCHGEMDDTDFARSQIGPTLNKQEFLRIATPEFLKKTIPEGRLGRMMIAWKKGVGGLSEKQIDNLVKYLKSCQRVEDKKLPEQPFAGDLLRGELWYRVICAKCHGDEGEGKEGQEFAYVPNLDRPPPLSAPALRNQSLLLNVSDSFIKENPTSGRCAMEPVDRIIARFERETGRQMPTFLPEKDFDNIAAFVRQWQIKGSVENGRFWYHVVCARCHGVEGRGVKDVQLKKGIYSGPIGTFGARGLIQTGGPTPRPINSEHFLNTASDDMNKEVADNEFKLYKMRLILATGNLEVDTLLDGNEVNDITLYIRSWQDEKPSALPSEEQKKEALILRRQADEFLGTDELDRAASTYASSARLNPYDTDALLALGETLVKLGRPKEAIDYLKQASYVNPLLVTPYITLGKIYLARAGDEREALYAFRKACIVAPGNAEAVSLLAQTYEKLGIDDFALRNWEKLERLSPEDLAPHLRIARILEKMKDYKGALEHCEKALQLGSKDPTLPTWIEKLKKLLSGEK